MPDFPGLYTGTFYSQIHSLSPASAIGGLCDRLNTSVTASTWPSANRAIYIPFIVVQITTAYVMAFQVAVQSGNCDVGIYTEQGVRLVSAGSTAVGAAGFQSINITDTVLTPGVYYMAMNCDNTTASFRAALSSALGIQGCGVQQQAVGAVALPDPATFANPASTYCPGLVVGLNATI